jgi:hypothetical protein
MQTVTNFTANFISFIIREAFTIATSLFDSGNIDGWYSFEPSTLDYVDFTGPTSFRNIPPWYENEPYSKNRVLNG